MAKKSKVVNSGGLTFSVTINDEEVEVLKRAFKTEDVSEKLAEYVQTLIRNTHEQQLRIELDAKSTATVRPA